MGIRNHITVWRALNRNDYHPYHFQRVQGLCPADYGPRERFAQWFLDQEVEDANFAERVLFTDESTFSRDGIFNNHNYHSWHQNNPHVIHESHRQHRYTVNVWAGIVHNQLIGHTFCQSVLLEMCTKSFLKKSFLVYWIT